MQTFTRLVLILITIPAMAEQRATDITNAFIQGESATAFAADALSRIEAVDENYKAVIVAGGEPVNQATQNLDSLSQAERAKLVLGGVPILIKDNIETAEWPTTAGSLALKDNYTNQDAEHVAQLRAAGAIILGKTNLSEWANFRSEQSISGWSGIGGQTRNAHDTTRSPCGSSSGSAVAVALGYVPIAIGSETDGSIVCPASVNGVVGFKPTHGMISGHGVVPIAATQDTAGPFANNVLDAALALSVMITAEADQAQRVKADLYPLKELADLKNIRIGILQNTQGYDNRRDLILGNAQNVLVSLGAELIPDLKVKPYKGFSTDTYDVLLYEFKHQIEEYLATLDNKLTLKDLIDFNEASDKELSLFDQSIFITAYELQLSEAEYKEKLNNIRQASADNGLDALINDNQLDIIIGITGGPAWTIDDINGDAFHGPSMSSFPAIGGHPHLTLPMGNIKGLPIGLSFVGARFDDAKVARIAALFERSN